MCTQLGLNAFEHRLLPTCVGGSEAFAGARVDMLASGLYHSAAVTSDGNVWTWGDGAKGKLGHGDKEPRPAPSSMGKEAFGGQAACMVACGASHTLVQTAQGSVWSCGCGDSGRLGHGDVEDKSRLTRVEFVSQFASLGGGGGGGARVVMIAAGGEHSVAATADGSVWTWGYGHYGQLGHNERADALRWFLYTCSCCVVI